MNRDPNAELRSSTPGLGRASRPAIGGSRPSWDADRYAAARPEELRASRVSFGSATRVRRTWPLVPLAPAAVGIIGVAVAIAIGVAGLDDMARASDANAAAAAELIAISVGARLGALTPLGKKEAIQLASRRGGAELLLVSDQGDVVVDAMAAPPAKAFLKGVLGRGRGEVQTARGRSRFYVRDIGGAPAQRLVTFVRAPQAPDGRGALVTALAALTTLLAGLAATFGYAAARDANGEVEFLRKRVQAMAATRIEPSGELVPVRAMDEVGILASSFDELVGRFVAAEHEYRANLERAHAADRDRAAFLAAVSHELRSPLNAILGFADILSAEVDGPLSPEALEDVDQIHGSGAHLLELINDILEFSALEGGQLKLARSEIDLAAIAAEVLREASPLVQGRPIAVRLEGERALTLTADPRRVRQILTNLVGNAIKFTQSGEVVVSLARVGAYARMAVRDTGPGIGDEERAVIFEEYKQTREERTRRRGTGLGLAIARRLVLLHGGTIDVESKLGSGSTFHVLLPIAARSHEASRA